MKRTHAALGTVLICLAAASHAGGPVFPGNDDTFATEVTPDGRYVVFASRASNLVPDDTNGTVDVFLFDGTTGIVRRATESVDGTQANGYSNGPSVSADGRFVAFSSLADNLVAGDTNFASEVFLKDMTTGVVERLTRHQNGTFPGGGLFYDDGQASISDDGSTIVWYGGVNLTNLPANDVGCKIYAVDRATLVTRLLVRTPTGDVVSCRGLRLAGGGAFAAFESNVPGLTANDTNGLQDTFRVRVSDGVVDLVSVATSGNSANNVSGYLGVSGGPQISSDGRYIAFGSAANDLVATPGPGEVYVRDMTAGVTTRVPGSAAIVLGMSPDGRFVSWNEFIYQGTGPLPNHLARDRTGNTTSIIGPAAFLGDTISFALNGSRWTADNATVLLPTTARFAALNDTNSSSDAVLIDRGGGAPVLASRAGAGQPGDGHSRSLSMSDAGDRVVFTSLASNLVAGDTNDARDVFLRTEDPATLTIVSRAAAGTLANGDSYFAKLSRNGTHVAFISSASNLAAGDTNGVDDVFVKNLGTGVVDQLTNGGVVMFALALSADGRYVAFATENPALTGGLGSQIVVMDTVTDNVQIATRTPGGTPSAPNVNLFGCTLQDGQLSMSADGRYLLFDSFRPDIIGLPVEERAARVFVYDRVANLVEHQMPGNTAATGCTGGISADGQRVAFQSFLALDPLRPSGYGAFVRDRGANTIRLALDLSTTAYSGNDGQPPPTIDASGRWVLMPSARPAEPGDTNQLRDVFLADRTNGRVTRESLTASWGQANGASGTTDSRTSFFDQNLVLDQGIALDVGATRIAFTSSASNLTPRDDNASDDVFVLDRATKSITRISTPPQAATDADRKDPSLSADGSTSVSLVAGDEPSGGGPGAKALGDKFSHAVHIDWQTGREEFMDLSNSGVRGNGASKFPSITPFAEFVAYASDATNLSGAADVNGATDVFVRDRTTGTTQNVTADANADCGRTAVAGIGDKWRVAFECAATNLPGTADTNGAQDVFVATEGEGMQVASVDSNEQPANAASSQPSVTPDGRFVAFSSLANNLVGSDANGVADVFVRDVVAGTTERVSFGPAGIAPNGASGRADIVAGSGPASWIAAYESEANNLVAGDVNGRTDIFIGDKTGAVVMASRGLGGAPANGPSFSPSLSRDGRYVTFVSMATNLVPSDANNRPDVFVHDLVTGTTTLASVDSAGAQSNDFAIRPAIGVDAQGKPIVAWDSPASNLAPNDDDGAIDLFRRNLVDGVTEPLPPGVVFASGFE